MSLGLSLSLSIYMYIYMYVYFIYKWPNQTCDNVSLTTKYIIRNPTKRPAASKQTGVYVYSLTGHILAPLCTPQIVFSQKNHGLSSLRIARKTCTHPHPEYEHDDGTRLYIPTTERDRFGKKTENPHFQRHE